MSTPSLVKIEKRGNVAVLTVNNPPVNTLSSKVREETHAALDEMARWPDVKAALLICEGRTFFSGADISEFSGPPQEVPYRQMFARFEQLTVPLVVAMHGTVMGGGLEISLACHYRLAAPSTRFSFPEVTLGIIPGAGGTQRMPRLIGVEKTLDMVLNAKPVDTKTAVEWGFVDAIVDGDLKEGALRYAAKLIAEGKGPRRTSERSVDPATGTPAIIERMNALAAKLYPNRVAPYTAIKAVRASLTLPFAKGLEYETELANESKVTPESKGAIHAFFAERETRKIPDLPAEHRSTRRETRGRRRRRHDGRRHCDLLRERRHPGHRARRVGRGPEARHGRHRQDVRVDGQTRPHHGGRESAAHGADHAVAQVRRPQSRRRDHRSRVRGHEAEAGHIPQARRGSQARRGARHEHVDARHQRHREGHEAPRRRHRPALLLAGECHAVARGHSHRRHGARDREDRHGARQTAAQDARAREGVLRLHRQPHDGRLRARSRPHDARRRHAARGRQRAREVRHGDGHARRVRHGRRRHRRQGAPGERGAVSAGPDVLPVRLRAVRRRTPRPEDQQGLLPLRARRSHAPRRSGSARDPEGARSRSSASSRASTPSRKSSSAASIRS